MICQRLITHAERPAAPCDTCGHALVYHADEGGCVICRLEVLERHAQRTEARY